VREIVPFPAPEGPSIAITNRFIRERSERPEPAFADGFGEAGDPNECTTR
jgi:hypothetical protein